MNILITGSSGYLGGCLTFYLKKNNGHSISTCSSTEAKTQNGKHFKIDWEDRSSIKKACQDQEIIIHCSSPNSKDTEINPKIALDFNSKVLDRFINQAINSNVKKFIYFSSAHIYKTPLLGHLKESTPLNPSHPYGISKKMAEETLLNYSNVDSFEFTIIRLSNAFGTPCNEKINPWSLVINDFCKQAIETKKIIVNAASNQTRNYVTIIEIVDLIRFILDKYSKRDPLPNIFNFGGQWTLNLVQLAQKIANEYYKWKGEKIDISFKNGFNIESPYLYYDFEMIKKAGFTSDFDYSREIKKLFENLSRKSI